MGDLLFARAHDLVGELICHFGGGPYSHVRVALGGGWAIDAVPGGVRQAIAPAGETVVALGLVPMQRAALLDRAGRWVGHPYGYLSYLSDLAHFAGWEGASRLLDGWERAEGALNCAQLAVRLLELPYPDAVTPSGLYVLLTTASQRGA